MKKTSIALCTAFVAGCQHAPEMRFPTYDPCFIYPVRGAEFEFYCSWTSGNSNFDVKKCIESAGIPVTATVPPGQTNATYDPTDGPYDKGEALRRANAARECISKDM